MNLKDYIRDIPDFPKPGILFKDITTLLKNSKAFQYCIDQMEQKLSSLNFDAILAIESRGFIFGAPLAYKMSKKLIPVRKKNKLPAETYSIEYDLEYGTDTLEIHKDAVSKGEKVIIIDDLLATGGTISAVEKLANSCEVSVEAIWFLIELSFLNGKEKLICKNIISEVTY